MSLTFRPSTSTREELRQSIYRHIRYTLARANGGYQPAELLKPLALAIRDRLVDIMLETERRYQAGDAKRLYYLSMEFLMGRALGDNLTNLGLVATCRDILAELGVELDAVLDCEPDAGLGNGGLGRLAACFLESLATLGMPGFGYGIDYEYGLFKQEIAEGYQREKPDRWKTAGTPVTIERPGEAISVPLYGHLEHTRDHDGVHHSVWAGYKMVVGVPADMPIAGFGGQTVNSLRLFSARASEDFDIEIFNRGDYIRAVEQKIASENISRVLYPSDSVMSGRELRLIQEYFLVACAVGDIVRRYRVEHQDFSTLPHKVAVQMNDTHPSLAVAELMRLLLDVHNLDWDQAWQITTATLAYTNHTLLPEALERWPVPLIEHVLPRHMEIIYGINHQFLRTVARRWPLDVDKIRRMSVIEEGHEKHVRMSSLAIVGSHSVNGVSELHSKLIKSTLVPDFAELWPERFNSKTNGVAHRRWLYKANPQLSALLSRALGTGWIVDLNAVRGLERFAEDRGVQEEFLAVKRACKQRLAKVIHQTSGVTVDPASLFDVHVKRIHEYKRQLLNVFRVIHDYLRITEDGQRLTVPRTFIFAGKAAPGYWAAKQIIKLINDVARVVNSDPRSSEQMRVVFIPDYRVSLAEVIMPAADLSQQVSTAGMEASGTGNMKLMMNGALTMGTLDGANIEIFEEVGEENIYIFGLKAEEIRTLQQHGSYHPSDLYHATALLRRVLDCLASDRFNPQEPGLYRWIFESIVNQGDRYFHLADLPSYLDADTRAAQDYLQREVWSRKALINIARSGKFSSDRTILEYSRDIWHIPQVPLSHAEQIHLEHPTPHHHGAEHASPTQRR